MRKNGVSDDDLRQAVMEMNEGGLSEVELRVLNELAYAAGAFRVFIHEGAILSKNDAINKINNA